MLEIRDGKALGRDVFGVPDGRYYSIEEYCVAYNVTKSAVRKWKSRGQIRAVIVFGKNYIPDSEAPYEGKKHNSYYK